MNATQTQTANTLKPVDPIEQAVLNAVDKCLGPFDAPLTLQTRFMDLGARSLELVAVAFELEDEFEIEIHQRSLNDFVTLDHAVAVVRALVAERSAAA